MHTRTAQTRVRVKSHLGSNPESSTIPAWRNVNAQSSEGCSERSCRLVPYCGDQQRFKGVWRNVDAAGLSPAWKKFQ